MATLETPTKIRELQRALYRRAKREPNFRFYALYDKVYREDVLQHAYALAKANGGAAGPDRKTFAEIEVSGREALLEELREELKNKRYQPGPIRRVYIPKLGGGERPLGIPNIRDRVVQTAVKLVVEPIFETTFDEGSYGFRPRRSAHGALAAIEDALREGMYWVIDADIVAYFDEIPQDRLMKAVAERIVDGAMLALVKMFLRAPIVDDREGGQPRRSKTGTPQGGVLSPLLANIYLHLMDRNFRRRVEKQQLRGRLVRYADDFAVLVPRRPEAELAWLRQVVQRLGLKLHPDKTRVLWAAGKDFEFLGHRLRWRHRKLWLDISKKALGRIRDELRRRTRQTEQSIEEVVQRLNLYIRGARQYFRRVRRHRMSKLDSFVKGRIARWWSRKHAIRWPSWSLVRGDGLQRRYGLERWLTPKAVSPADSRRAW